MNDNIIFYSHHPKHDYLNLLIESLGKITNVKLVRFRELLKYFLSSRKFKLHLQFQIKQHKFLQILILAKLRNIPIFWTPHDLKPLTKSRKYILRNFFLKHVDKIIVLSRANKKELTKLGIDSKKIKVIPLPNFNFYSKYQVKKILARQKLNISQDKIVFLQFGPYRQYKGYHLSASAFNSLPKDLRNKSELVFAGKVWNHDKPQNIDLRNINTKLLGNKYFDGKEIGLIFSAADVVLCPYLWISQSGSIFLALAFGKPSIASNIGGIPEVIRDGEEGFLVKPDPNDIQSAMVKIIKNPILIDEMGNKALKRSKKDTWEEAAKIHLEMYRKIN